MFFFVGRVCLWKGLEGSNAYIFQHSGPCHRCAYICGFLATGAHTWLAAAACVNSDLKFAVALFSQNEPDRTSAAAGTSFVGNAGPAGGAMGAMRSAMNVTDSTFHRNMADSEIGAAGQGEAVWVQASVASIHDCTFSENYASECAHSHYLIPPSNAVVQSAHRCSALWQYDCFPAR